jgi:glycosyltransferase involved in cell wall biosynthesis
MAISYSVIIPAYNEQQWLGPTLAGLKRAMDAVALPGEVIVVDNNSTDRTAEVARQHGAQTVFEPVNQISRARNAGARQAGGKYLIFLDADTALSPELLAKALANLASGGCCGGGALVHLDGLLPWYGRWVPLLWNRLSVRCRWAAGCFIYCLREGFAAVGGFSEQVFASEEIGFSRKLRIWGKPRGLAFEIIATPRIVTSSRKMQDHPIRNLLAFCFVLVFPFAVLSRRLSSLWYHRWQKPR